MEFWADFFATEFCICMFLSQEKELNFPFCLLHYSHHIWQFGGMRLCFFMTLKFFFKSVLCAWRPLPSLNILQRDPSQLSVQQGTVCHALGWAKQWNLPFLEHLLCAGRLCVCLILTAIASGGSCPCSRTGDSPWPPGSHSCRSQSIDSHPGQADLSPRVFP